MRKTFNRQSESGFTLIEVLVALLILLIGLLGVVGMQYLSLKQVNNSQLRSQVAIHAQTMVERIRANDNDPLTTADVGTWEAKLVQDVPTADGSVAFATNSGVTTATVTITWDERQLNNDVEEQTMTVTARVN